MANGLIYEQLEKGELRTPQGKKVGSFTTNTLPRQVGKPKKRKGQKTSIPQSTYAKGMKRVKDQMKAATKKSDYHYREGMELGFSGGPFGTAESRAKHRAISKKVGKKATALRKFTERDKRFRVK